MKPWMQGLHASVEHFRKPGVVSNLGYRCALIGEELRRTARGQDLDLESGQSPSQLGEAGLVGNADQRRPDGNHILILSD